ncbi:hypothetical protein [Mucilaginibacter sp.]
MNIDDNIQKDLSAFEHIAHSDHVIDQKLDELISLLSASKLNSDKVRNLQRRFNQAVENAIPYSTSVDSFDAFRQVDGASAASREELLDEFSMLLSTHQLDSKASHKYLLAQKTKRFITGIIGVIMITLGFAMIVMPAPPYFEMFTIFYFNHDDGVTLMDLISLLVIFTGIYLLIRAIIQQGSRQ